MKWPAHNVRKTGRQEQKKLAAWLAEWELEGVLAEPSTPKSDARVHVAGRAGFSQAMYDRDKLAEGDIRLLRPSPSTEPPEYPLYVAVLPSERQDYLWWVPFGRFATPALTSEWRTGMKHVALQVLCFWNAQEVEKGRAPPSWRVRRLTERQLEDILTIHNSLENGAALPDRLQKGMGPPLVHPLDPRHEYQAEDRERIQIHFADRFTQAVTRDEEEEGLYLSEWVMAPVAWLLAAEGREKYGVAGAVYVTDDGAVIVAVFEEARNRVRIRIMNRDGFPCLSYEKGHVEAKNGEKSEPVRNGVTHMSIGLEAPLVALIDPGGNRVLLRRRYRENPK